MVRNCWNGLDETSTKPVFPLSRRALVKPLHAYILACTVLITGCQDRPQPSFLSRSYQDCKDGDQQACQMLRNLQQPTEIEQKEPVVRRITPVQSDVAAMQEGVKRAKSSPSTKIPDIVPSSVPESAPDTHQPATQDGP